MDSQQNITPNTPAKKEGSFKRKLIWLCVVGIVSGSGYLAYQQGALDGYLPTMLKAHKESAAQIKSAAESQAPAASVASPSSDAQNADAPATSAAQPAATATDLQAALVQQLQQQSRGNEVVNSNMAAAPIVLAINGAPANALLTAYDAQWQWAGIQQDFTQRADTTLTLQNVQNLKAQLQAVHEPAFGPALSALAQAESQLKLWSSVPTATYLSDLQRALVAVEQLDVKTNAQNAEVNPAALSWWERIIASMKNVVEIKKIDSAKEAQMLNPATAALVKQSILARLMSAQWAAQTGQWPLAQANAVAAQTMAVQWSDPTALSAPQALIDNKVFPAAPDFSAVTTALQQARAQLTSIMRAQQTAPAVPATPAPSSTPVQKGGA
ncbi:hypothetical protein [Hydromonas duriensis]|uniref:Uncharacterized protein HemX n=1 Tax=Hydromonas duriensis TaxID=1527608 RepID=A0A4R6Y417_9BURK|nr:hypothetical protein [Hydromonas duriensis]TDR31145.1 uncharacterized protein HemX [Hydromonas duriensis]